jgi:hypothetical protein
MLREFVKKNIFEVKIKEIYSLFRPKKLKNFSELSAWISSGPVRPEILILNASKYKK